MSLTKMEQNALNALDMPGLLRTLGDLVALPTLGGQETPGQEYVAAFLQRIGAQTDVWELDMETLRRQPAYGVEVERERPLGVAGVIGEGRGGRTLILNGHMDVVPIGDPANWRYPPWQMTIANGRAYGRGTVDMKGGLACALHAVKAIQGAGIKLHGKVIVESVVGEEDGGLGTLAAILRGYQGDGAILIEPTEMIVAPAQAGALNFQVTVPGLSAHGCVREEGVSAIERFVPVHQALMELEQRRNQSVKNPLYARYRLPFALSIGQIEAGNWASSVPERLAFRGRYGMPPGESAAEARRQFEEAVQRAAHVDPWLREHAPIVEWWGGQLPPAQIPADHPLTRTVQHAYADATGQPARLEGMTYGADMRLFVNEGQTPALLFGPGNVRQAHAPDEYVPISELEDAARSLILTVLRFC